MRPFAQYKPRPDLPYFGPKRDDAGNPILSAESTPETAKPAVPTVDEILAYEDGTMDEDETVNFFQRLVNSGLAWQLQGSYGRTALALLNQGRINDPRHATPTR